jgi:dynein heavy chain
LAASNPLKPPRALLQLNWIAAKAHLDYFVREARRFCAEVEATVADFKSSSARIAQLARSIGETLVVHVEKKKIYENGEFEAKQVRFALLFCQTWRTVAF